MKKHTFARAPLLGALLAGVLALACADEPAATEAAAAPPQPPAPAEAQCCLRAGGSAHGTLPVQGRQAFAVDLGADDVLEVLAEQEGGDLALVVRSPNPEGALRWDTPVGREEPEHLHFRARQPGRHVLEVENLQKELALPFRLEVLAAGPASPAERQAADAATAVAQAHELRRGGEWDRAAERYGEGAEGWSALADARREADALLWRAWCLERSGRHEDAVATLEPTVHRFRALRDEGGEAGALEALGTALRHAGRGPESLSRYQEALDLRRRLEDGTGEARVLGLLAGLHKARNEMSAAELRYLEAAELWSRLGRPRDQAIVLANLAGLYTVVGQAEVALGHLARAAALLPVVAAPGDRAFLLEESGRAYRRLERRQDAISAYRRALALRREEGTDTGSAIALDGLARVHYEAEDYTTAEELYGQALALFQERGDRLWEATVLQSLGWLHLRQGDPRQALSHLQRALPVFQDLDFPAGEAAALSGIARVERALGHLDAAATWAERALDAVEALRSGADRADLRASILSGRQDYFDFAVDTRMALHRRDRAGGHAAEAFHLSERGRARWLLDALALPQTPLQEDPRVPALRDRVNAAAAKRLALLEHEASERELERTEQDLALALEALRRTTTRRRGSREPSPGAPLPLSLDEVQRQALDPDTLLLSYDLGEERSYLWAVTHDSAATFVLPAGETIEEEARRVHDLLAHSHERGTSEQVEMRTARLSELLLRPVAHLVARHRRLLVSVDGTLHSIPFGPLPHPSQPGILLERHEVVHVPSASVLVWLNQRPRRETERGDDRPLVAVLAHPVFNRDDERVEEAARLAGGTEEPAGAAVLGGPRLPPLPNTAEEAEAILALVGPDRGRNALSFDAEKDLVTSGALSEHRILHFATHGWFSSEHPELSALVLSRFDRQGRPRDGVLWSHEVAALRLEAEMVVLSACDTGLGAEIDGEGLVGLAHAFFRAGAPTVVASLWRVDDQAAVELMKAFYSGYLDQNLPPAEALRRAQLEVRSRPQWRRPFYWAGFVLQGRR